MFKRLYNKMAFRLKAPMLTFLVVGDAKRETIKSRLKLMLNLTDEQAIEYVQRELIKVMKGDSPYMQCPYCGGKNYASEEGLLCCRRFAYMSHQALALLETQELIDNTKRIAEKING